MTSSYNDDYKDNTKTDIIEETPLLGEKQNKKGFDNLTRNDNVTNDNVNTVDNRTVNIEGPNALDLESGESTHLKQPSLSLGPQAVPTKMREIRDTNGNLVQTQEENLTHYVTTPPRKLVNEVRELDGKKKSETSN